MMIMVLFILKKTLSKPCFKSHVKFKAAVCFKALDQEILLKDKHFEKG